MVRIKKSKELARDELVVRISVGVILIVSAFVPMGRWLSLALGLLFLLSAAMGICWSCRLYKVLNPKDKNPS